MCPLSPLPERDEVPAAETALQADLGKNSTMVTSIVTSITQHGPVPWRRLELGVPAGVAAMPSLSSPHLLSWDANGAASQKAPSLREPCKVRYPQGRALGSTQGSPILSDACRSGARGQADTPDWCHRLSHGQHAASVVASGTSARGSGDKNQISPFLAPGTLRAAGSATRNGRSPMFIVFLSQS